MLYCKLRISIKEMESLECIESSHFTEYNQLKWRISKILELPSPCVYSTSVSNAKYLYLAFDTLVLYTKVLGSSSILLFWRPISDIEEEEDILFHSPEMNDHWSYSAKSEDSIHSNDSIFYRNSRFAQPNTNGKWIYILCDKYKQM